jgi:hypothetical protein
VQTPPLILENGIRGCRTKFPKLIYKSNNSNFKHSGLLFPYRHSPFTTEFNPSHAKFLPYLPTPMYRVLPEKFTAAQQVKEVPDFVQRRVHKRQPLMLPSNQLIPDPHALFLL